MAARTLYGTPTTTACSFWQLPGHQRASIYRHAFSRSFTSTAPKRNDFVDVIVQPQIFLLDSIHAIGLPWWAAIPTFAVLVRGVIVYHFGTKQAREREKNRIMIAPVIGVAAGSKSRFEQWKEGQKPKNNINPADRQVEEEEDVFMPTQMEREFARELSRKVKRDKDAVLIPMEYRRLVGAQIVRPISFVSLFMFLTSMEAIRHKVGGEGGLLRLLSWPMFTTDLEQPEGLPRTKELANEIGTTSQIVSLDELVDAPTDGLATDGSLAGLELSSYDPTTALEGLSFCTNLTIPDSTGTLPIILLFSMLFNTIFTQKRAMHSESLVTWLKSFKPWPDFFQIGFAVLVYSFVGNMPAGLYLYWITSTWTTKIIQVWMAMKDPLPAPIQACKSRPQQSTL